MLGSVTLSHTNRSTRALKTPIATHQVVLEAKVPLAPRKKNGVTWQFKFESRLFSAPLQTAQK